jgi:hypothetical protein
MSETEEQYHWTQSYNITGVIEGFNHQMREIIGINYQGKIHLVIFENELLGEIEHIFSDDPYLAGWLPTYDNKESEYSFILIPEVMMGRDIVVSKIPSFKDYIYLKLHLFQNPFNKEMVIALEEEIVEG